MNPPNILFCLNKNRHLTRVPFVGYVPSVRILLTVVVVWMVHRQWDGIALKVSKGYVIPDNNVVKYLFLSHHVSSSRGIGFSVSIMDSLSPILRVIRPTKITDTGKWYSVGENNSQITISRERTPNFIETLYGKIDWQELSSSVKSTEVTDTYILTWDRSKFLVLSVEVT